MAGHVRLELLGRIPDEDEKGRYRDTARHYSTIDIADPLVNLGGLIQKLEKKSRQFSYRDFPRSVFDDCKAALRCDPRPIDRYLDNYLSYTNFEVLKQRRSGFHGLNRVVVNATVTTKDNLSIRLWLKTLDDAGRWIDAPEWRDIALRRAVLCRAALRSMAGRSEARVRGRKHGSLRRLREQSAAR